MDLKLFTDGGSRGNPGHAACGYVIFSGAGIVLEKCGNYLGVTTNNQAEYAGLISGIEKIIEKYPGKSVEICMDSLLVVNQVKGLFQVKNGDLKPKNREVKQLLTKLPQYSIGYVPRIQNAVADSLVNEALDRHLGL